MGLFDLFKGRPPPPQLPPEPKPATPMRLRPAPSFVPLPVAAGDHDATLSAAWLTFQQANPGASFERFLDQLTTDNRELAAEIAKTRTALEHYQ